MPTLPAIAEQLHELHEDSADRANRLADDREDLVRELADDGYTEEALRLIVASRR